MPKFKVGDKIEFEMDGKKVSGTITRDYNSPDHAMYDVRVGTKTMTIADTPMHPANACKNANFKVGDKVRIKGWQGIWEVTKTPPGMLEVKSDDGFVGITQVEKATPVKGANACKNAKIVTPENFSSLRVGDKVDFRKSRYYKGIGVVTKVYDEDIIDIKDDKGEILEVHSDDIMNAKACNSRNPIVAKAMNACGTAKNAVTITLDSRKRDGWVTGKVNGYDFEAKVFDEGSDFGIKSGRVSKLWMRKGDETVNYDRGWDERPKSAEAKAAYTELLRKMESLPKVMNACGTARNAKFIGRPPARVKQLIEQMEKILEVTDPNDTTDRMMGEVSSLGWSWDDSRRAWVYDDTDIKTDIKWAFKKFLEAVNRSDLEKAVDNISDKAMANDFRGMLKIAQKYAR